VRAAILERPKRGARRLALAVAAGSRNLESSWSRGGGAVPELTWLYVAYGAVSHLPAAYLLTRC